MTLKELKLDNVRIGTPAGGFIYCGNNLNFDELDRHNARRQARRICECEAKIRKLNNDAKDPLTAYKRYCANYAAAKKNCENFTAKLLTYEEWQVSQKKALKNAWAALHKATRDAANYKKVAERNILDIYDSITEKGVKIIIIEGNEAGVAWTSAEYEEARKELFYEGIES